MILSKTILKKMQEELERFYEIKYVDYAQEYICFGDDTHKYYLVLYLSYVNKSICLRKDKVVNENIDSIEIERDGCTRKINELLERNF